MNDAQIPHIDTTSMSASGRRGVVTCAHPLAASAGVRILESGGNAYDAIVAMSWALTVVEPTMSGLLGVTTYLTRTSHGEYHWLDGVVGAPRQLTRNQLHDARTSKQVGAEVLVPTLVPSNLALLARFGTAEVAATLAPAIDLASAGFEVTPITEFWMRLARESSGRVLPEPYEAVTDGRSNVLKQPKMASALQAIESSASTWLRSDARAQSLVALVQQAGGVLTLDDLESVSPVWRHTVQLDAGGWRFHSPGWPNASFEALAIIKLMSLSDEPGSSATVRLVRSITAAAQIRQFRWRDAMTQADVEELLSSIGEESPAGAAADSDVRAANIQWSPPPGTPPSHTSHLAAIDAEGNTVCATQTLGGLFGGGLWLDGLPVNGLGMYLYADSPAAPASCAPSPARPPASILEMLIAEIPGSDTWFSMGSPGGFVIPGAVAQGALGMCDHWPASMAATGPEESVAVPVTTSDDAGTSDVAAAIEQVLTQPRLAVGDGGNVSVESRISEPGVEGLRDQGYNVVRTAEWAWAMGCLNYVTSDAGMHHAGADPRRAAAALAQGES